MRSECGLQTAFGDLAKEIPDDPSGEGDFIFRSDTLPVPPTVIETDRIVVRKVKKDYNSWYRVDLLELCIEAASARELGVFLFSCVFHRPERAELHLCHPRSDIRAFVWRSLKLEPEDPPMGLSLVPFAFRYFPSTTEKLYWLNDIEVTNLPLLALSSTDELVCTEEDWQARDTVFLESTLLGSVRLAALLLDAGCPGNPIREYALEGDAGNRGVAPMSAELRIVMPGSNIWEAYTEVE